MRNLLSNPLARPAATRRLRAGILALLLATYAAVAAPATGAEPVQATGAHAAIATVPIAEGNTREADTAVHGGDIVVSLRMLEGPSMPSPDGAHAWAG